MRRTILSIVAGTSALAFAAPASASVIICAQPNCAPTDENVLVEGATDVSTVTGVTNQTGATVTFTSPLGENLDANAQGQAEVSASDGLLNGLTMTLENGYTFSSAVFNLFPIPGQAADEATQVFITYLLNGVSYQESFDINLNGQNYFGIYGTGGEVFTSIGFVANPTTDGISDVRQLRLGGVMAPAVPEPGTWGMMLLGFAGAGFALRRSRRTRGNVLQIA